jgi:S1-C subfamily serine protease
MALSNHWLDLLLIAALVLVAVGGMRRGLAVEVLRYLGLLVGLLIGAWMATRVGLLVSDRDSLQRVLIGVAVFVFVAMLGQAVGTRVGVRVRRAANGGVARRVDAVGGAVVATLVAAVVMWLLGNVLGSGPVPVISRAIADSTVLRTIDRYAPRPPAAFAEVRRLFDTSVFPDVFAELRPPVADGAPPPVAATPGIDRAARSTVRVESLGCGGLVFGSGFPITRDLYVTNAHVVAGTDRQSIRTRQGLKRDAVVVRFDPVRDIAVLRVQGMRLRPLTALPQVRQGTQGAVIGFPGGGTQQIVGAQVVSRTSAVGRDIYSRSLARREIYVLRAKVRKGDSGGPIVDRQGRLIGVVFAASTLDGNEGYALTNAELSRAVGDARSSTRAVALGQCAS